MQQERHFQSKPTDFSFFCIIFNDLHNYGLYQILFRPLNQISCSMICMDLIKFTAEYSKIQFDQEGKKP